MNWKQVAVLRMMLRGNPDGSHVDIHQLLHEITPTGVRGAMLRTIAHLYAHGLVEAGDLVRRSNRMKRTYKITQAGIDMIRPSVLPTSKTPQKP